MAPFHTALVELSSEGQNKGIEACSVQIKSNLSSAVQGVLPVMSLTDAVSSTLKEEGWEVSSTVAETYIEFLEDLLSDIYLFSETPDIMTVILDTLNYESDYLTTRLDI